MESSDGEDRFSALPDPVIHNILPYLDMADVVRTSILSKRWRHLWLSTPYLYFDFLEWMNASLSPDFSDDYDLWKQEQHAFMEFVTNVLDGRGGRDDDNNSNSIILFELYSNDDYYIDPIRLLSWIHASLKRNVQEIVIDVPVSDDFDLPHTLFTSNLRVLNLYFTNSYFGRLPQSFSTAAGIISLELHNVLLPNGDDSGDLIMTCSLLRHLELSHCIIKRVKVLVVCTPQLESLKLVYCDEDDNKSWTVRLITPNIKSLVVEENLSHNDYTFDCSAGGNLSSLLTAKMELTTTVELNTERYSLAVEQWSAYMIKILPRISNVQSLGLSLCAIRAITECPELMERISNLFPNLILLKLSARFQDPGVWNFLEKLPHIQTLIWKGNMSNGSYRDWGADLSFKSIFSCLQTVKIRMFKGSEVELKLLAFLLEKAALLKKLIIKVCPSISGKQRSWLYKKLSLLPRASSIVLIVF